MALHKILLLGLALITGLVASGSNIITPPAPIPGSLIPIATSDDMKFVPAVAYDGIHDQFLVVWEHVLPQTGIHEIDGALISADGALLQTFVVSSYSNDELTPDVAFDSINSRYLVVWSYDYFGDQSDFDIYGRLIPWSGPDPGINEFAIDQGNQSSIEPKVAYGLHSDEFFILWNNKAFNSTPASISGTIRDYNGSSVPVTVYTNEFMLGVDSPALAYDGASNNFMVAWQVKRELSGWDIEAQRVGSAGQLLGPILSISGTFSGDELHPSVAACPNLDMYLVVYDFPGSISRALMTSCYYGNGIRVPGGGTEWDKSIFWPEAACAPGGDHFQVTLAQEMVPAGQRQILATTEVHGPHISIGGPDSRLDDSAFGSDSVYPAIASGKLPSLVVWEQVRDQGGYTDIYGRIIYSYGVYLPTIRK
jgi:hypothetical protein